MTNFVARITSILSIGLFKPAKSRTRRGNSRRDHCPALIEILEARRLLSSTPIGSEAIVSSIPAPSNDPFIDGSPLIYVKGAAPEPVVPQLILSNSSSDQFSGATIHITGNYHPGEDRLTFYNSSATQWSWDEASGTLTLIGVTSVADYQTMLRSVCYQDVGGNPSLATRTLRFDVSNAPPSAQYGLVNQPVETAPIRATAPLTPPQFDINVANRQIKLVEPVTVETSPIDYVANDPATVISSELALQEGAISTLYGARIQIVENYHLGEDRLTFENSANVNWSWNESTGVLLLLGAASVDDYQTMLRSVRYQNVGGDPNLFRRTVSYAVVDQLSIDSFSVNAGAPPPAPMISFNDNLATRQINIIPPGLNITVESPPLVYATGDAATFVSPGLVLTDNSLLINGAVLPKGIFAARIQITGNYQAGQDRLTFENTGNVPWNWDESTGTLTLTGGASIGIYQAMLRSVRYQDVGGSPSLLPRSIRFSVADDMTSVPQSISLPGGGPPPASQPVYSSHVGTREINMIHAGVYVAVESTPLAYTAGGSATPISPGLVVTDSNGRINGLLGVQALFAARVQITGNYQAGQDRLTFENTSNLQWSWDENTGLLTLSGDASIADYEVTLRSVRYQDVGGSPSTLLRTVSFTVADTMSVVPAIATPGQPAPVSEPIFSSNVATRQINVTPSQASGSQTFGLNIGIESSSLAYAPHAAAAVISPGLTLTGAGQIAGAKVWISGNYQFGQDRLTFYNTANVQWNWDESSGTLTLDGVASISDYQTMLRSFMYQDVGGLPSTLQRTITFTAKDTSAVVSSLYNSNLATRNVTFQTT